MRLIKRISGTGDRGCFAPWRNKEAGEESPGFAGQDAR